MTFTIPPFWCGVIVTLVGEFVTVVIVAVVKSIQNKHGKRKPWYRK